MQGSSLSRRVRVMGVEPEDVGLRAELFRTFASYGVIEDACFEEDYAFHSGAAVLQFQRLFSSEKLQNDMEATGRRWSITFLPPVVHVGTELLLTSPKTIDTTHVRSLIGENASGVIVEEKFLSLPGAVRGEPTGDLEGTADLGSKTTGARDSFLKALSSVKVHAIGRFAIWMAFATTHDANNFLSTHQMYLAASKEVYAVHIGSNEALQNALKQVLLTRRSVKDLTKGSVLRGFVLPQRQSGGGSNPINGGSINSHMTTCEVDAGLTRKGRPVVLRTQTNFVKVHPWDTVEVRLTSSDIGSEETFVEAELRSVVSTGPGPAEVQKPVPNFHRGRQFGGSIPAPTAAMSKKALAGKLYQALHARKAKSDSVGERLHGFPQGLHAFSVVSVCVQRVGDDGLYARTVAPPHATPNVSSREWPVFVPSFFVPCEGGMSWRDFAVPGERMTVTLLYAMSIGASEAALRLVASKREADMQRASTLVTETITTTTNAASSSSSTLNETCTVNAMKPPLSVGTTFSGSRAVWLPRTPSTKNPVYILLPSSSSSPVLRSVTILLYAKETSADQRPEEIMMDAGLHPFVISEVMNNDCFGYYAVAMEEAAYRQMEAERRAVESVKESKQDELLQRILTEVLSHGASVVGAGGGGENEEGRKRPRSP